MPSAHRSTATTGCEPREIARPPALSLRPRASVPARPPSPNVFGVAGRRLGVPALLGGALFGVAVWLLNDELAVPALGLAKPPWRYPVSTHVKALAAHLVYGATTGAGIRLADAALR